MPAHSSGKPSTVTMAYGASTGGSENWTNASSSTHGWPSAPGGNGHTISSTSPAPEQHNVAQPFQSDTVAPGAYPSNPHHTVPAAVSTSHDMKSEISPSRNRSRV